MIRSPQGPLIDTGRTVHPSRPTSNTPPRAMAVEDMLSDCPKSEPAAVVQLALDARKDIGVRVREVTVLLRSE
jgi:hypothetical protein